MKRLSPLSNFLYLVVIIVTFSFVNKHPTVFGKHNKGGGHHVKPEPVPPQVEPVVPPLPVGPLPVVPPLPIVPPLPVVPPQVEPVVPPHRGHHAGPKSDTTYEIIVINQASAGMDTVNVACQPGASTPGPPGVPPNPTCGPPVDPHLLKQGERFSWTFEYPDPSADISYSCRIDWTGHNQGLVSFFNKDTYTDAECKSDEGNNCYWAIAPDGFYHAREDAPFPGPAWTYRWPWGL